MVVRVRHQNHWLYLVEIDGLLGILAIPLTDPHWLDGAGNSPASSAVVLNAMGQSLSENPVLADWLIQSWMVDPDQMPTSLET